MEVQQLSLKCWFSEATISVALIQDYLNTCHGPTVISWNSDISVTEQLMKFVIRNTVYVKNTMMVGNILSNLQGREKNDNRCKVTKNIIYFDQKSSLPLQSIQKM